MWWWWWPPSSSSSSSKVEFTITSFRTPYERDFILTCHDMPYLLASQAHHLCWGELRTSETSKNMYSNIDKKPHSACLWLWNEEKPTDWEEPNLACHTSWSALLTVDFDFRWNEPAAVRHKRASVISGYFNGLFVRCVRCLYGSKQQRQNDKTHKHSSRMPRGDGGMAVRAFSMWFANAHTSICLSCDQSKRIYDVRSLLSFELSPRQPACGTLFHTHLSVA